MKLIIVESPKKAKTISAYLKDKGYSVIASKGHVIDLPKKSLGIDVDNMFIPFFEVIKNREKDLEAIKEKAKVSTTVFLATDPDREGEAIGYHIEREIKKDSPDKDIKRLILHEITRDEVLKALENPTQINIDRVESQITRRIIDRIIGFYLSPFLWKRLKNNKLSAGRVQSTVLNFIVEREKEIIDFVPETFFQMFAEFKNNQDIYKFNLLSIADKKSPFKNKDELDNYKRSLEKEFKIESISREKKFVYSLPPFTTSSLQKEAFNRLKFSSYKTMKIAQELYEGVKIDNKITGLITYMRTDSVRVSDLALKSLRFYIKENYPEFISPAIRTFKNSNKVQDAHEAIRPTDIRLTPEVVKKYLDPDSFKLYELIYNRFIATQMKPSVWEKIEVKLNNNGGIWEGVFYKLIDIGFEKFYPVSKFNVIEEFNLGNLIPYKITIKKRETSPPPRYTEASIIEKMEKEGIGRPSTYSTTVSILLSRRYIERYKNSLKPTKLGFTVDAILSNYFKDLICKEFTSKMEEELDKIETRDSSRLKVLNEFYSVVTSSLNNSQSFDCTILKSKYVQGIQVYYSEPCPKCGSRLIKREGKYGPFFGCERYPECSYTLKIKKGKNRNNINNKS